MDYDRRSNVSSFYGGRKSSMDALNADFPAAASSTRPRDDASSFYNPDPAPRSSMDPLNTNRASSAGYNRGSFFHAGREEPLKGGRDEEEEAANRVGEGIWDVYADFNNAGPRYSSAFGGQTTEKGYQQLPPPTPRFEEDKEDGPQVEMVTVPALGPEWGREEMRNMTKAGRKEKKSEVRREKWIAWNRGERGICGKYFTRKSIVIGLFCLCVVVATVLGITIPRVPAFSFLAASPLQAATGSWNNSVPTYFNRAPANFSFPAFASLQLDTTSNYIPVHFTSLTATAYDLTTGQLVGVGSYGAHTFPAKSFPDILFPMNFTYVASNDSDQTWANWYNACKSSTLYANGTRPPLEFSLVIDMKILGLPTAQLTSTEINTAACPIELSPTHS